MWAFLLTCGTLALIYAWLKPQIVAAYRVWREWPESKHRLDQELADLIDDPEADLGP